MRQKITLKTKRKIYLSACVVLGILLAAIFHCLLEIYIINLSLSKGIMPVGYIWVKNPCFLDPMLSTMIFITGIAGGYFLGLKWWKIVYIEKRHWKNEWKRVKRCLNKKIKIC